MVHYGIEMPSLVIVSNRLPMSVKKVDGSLVFEQSSGGLATGLTDYVRRGSTKWIGWPGIASDDLTRAERAQITRELRKSGCYPVFLTQKQLDDYYNGYSNSVIWPLFHNLPVKDHVPKLWRGYREANSLFTEEALRLSKPGSTIWVHDYHLMLVPQLLRRAGRGDKIGFFLHIPFPAPTSFAPLLEAKSLLHGMLGADLVGFHTRSYTEAFLADCDALLGLANDAGRLLIGQRPVRVTEFPMGIDYGRFSRATRLPHKHMELHALRQKYQNKQVILTVDRLDMTKGLVERISAYQALLRQQPKWHGKLVMVMIVSPSRLDVVEYQQLKVQVDAVLAEITDEFETKAWQPIDFIYETVPIDTVMTYYQLADVAFIAPLIDGMNLVAKEFVASKPLGSGVLVLSETAGAAEELRDAVLVNPSESQSMVDGLTRALAMPKHELRRRARSMQEHIQEFTVQKWAGTFIRTLQRPVMLPISLSHPLRNRTKSLNPAVQKTLVGQYQRARKRLLLLDYDGTLCPFFKNPDDSVPSPEVVRLLKRLGSDKRNEVVIISGRKRRDLQAWLGKLPLTLVAEHGAFVRPKGVATWQKTAAGDKAWQQPVLDLFERYAFTTPGSHVEQKEWALVWHYRTASPYASQKNLVALKRLLGPIAKQYDLRVRNGSKILEVTPLAISKGRTAEEQLSRGYDFVLAAGDDTTDEDMFAALPPDAYSVKVGHGKTLARFRVANVPEMLTLLGKLNA